MEAGPSTKRARVVKKSNGNDADGKAIEIGIIGAGDMGKLYISKLVEAGWQ